MVGMLPGSGNRCELVLAHFMPTGLPAYDNVGACIKAVWKTYSGELVIGLALG